MEQVKKDSLHGIAAGNRPKHKPVKVDLVAADGSCVVLNTAKRVIERHQKVIRALANL